MEGDALIILQQPRLQEDQGRAPVASRRVPSRVAPLVLHPPPEGQAWQRRMQRRLMFRAMPAALQHMHVTPNEYILLFNGTTSCKLYFIQFRPRSK